MQAQAEGTGCGYRIASKQMNNSEKKTVWRSRPLTGNWCTPVGLQGPAEGFGAEVVAAEALQVALLQENEIQECQSQRWCGSQTASLLETPIATMLSCVSPRVISSRPRVQHSEGYVHVQITTEGVSSWSPPFSFIHLLFSPKTPRYDHPFWFCPG